MSSFRDRRMTDPSTKEVAQTLRSWIEKTSRSVLTDDENFFEAGHIDSLEAINLVERIEQEFGIRFENREFQDRRFVTVSGLAEIISDKVRVHSSRSA